MNTTSLDAAELRFSDIAAALKAAWKAVFGGAVLVGAAAWAATFLITPTFVSRASFIAPQQQQQGAAAALASLGGIGGLAGAAAGLKTTGDQYVSLMESARVRDAIVNRFDLVKAYGAQYPSEARVALGARVSITMGKKDNLIFINVEDTEPLRAAAIANAHIDELSSLLSSLATTEAQQRRVFFEKQMKDAKDRLASAQKSLIATGFNAAELKAEPRAASDTYAKAQAELSAAEVRMALLRTNRMDSSPEVLAQQSVISSLRSQIARMEAPSTTDPKSSFVDAYREFKYQETMFEIYAKQFEIARLDEAKDGALVQVLDKAEPAVRRAKPRRLTIAGAVALLAALIGSTVAIVRHRRRASHTPVA
jgi:uncharacterized protein involved in exopolysaccharide biosynthesis